VKLSPRLGLSTPQAHNAVSTRRGQNVSAGRELQAFNARLIASQGQQLPRPARARAKSEMVLRQAGRLTQQARRRANSIQQPPLGTRKSGQPRARRQDFYSEWLAQNRQVGVAGNERLRARGQSGFDELVILRIAADAPAKRHRYHPHSGNLQPFKPRRKVCRKAFLPLYVFQGCFVFVENRLGNNRREQAALPDAQDLVRFAPPKNGRNKDAGVNDGEHVSPG